MVAGALLSERRQGAVSPQVVFANRRFRCVGLDPPDFSPGSWIGAGKAVYNHERREFLLTARPRTAQEKERGYAVCVYRSDDGEAFELLASLSKVEISEKVGLKIHSLEGTQLLKDPLTARWHLYISVDTGSEFVWGGLYWQTLLLTAPDPGGTWRAEGLVLHNDEPYDANQARDCTVDIVDGLWFCLYRAVDGHRRMRPALATSHDGIAWTKRGVFTVDGGVRFVFLSGTIFAGTDGPLFMGLERPQGDPAPRAAEGHPHQGGLLHGTGPSPRFVAYNIDCENMNLETVFRSPWVAGSPYEHRQHPLLGYSTLLYDPLKHRMLNYVEAIDARLTKEITLNGTVERVLLYETPL
jgi:hypothetical protein